MGREKEPFYGRWRSQDRRRREHDEDEYEVYEDDLGYSEEDEYEVGDMQDIDGEGSNITRRRSATPLPPFPSTGRNIYPRTLRARRMAESETPDPPLRPGQTRPPKRRTYNLNEPQLPTRRSAEPHQRPAQQTTRTRTADFSHRPTSSKPSKRKVWPIFLIGCSAGAVSLVLAVAIIVLIAIYGFRNDGLPGFGNKEAAIQGEPETQTIELSSLSQLIVCDPAGNVSLNVDPNVASPTITTTKTALHATNRNEADQLFRQISVAVEAQPSGQSQKPLTCQKPQANDTSTSGTLPTAAPTATNNTVLSVNILFPHSQAGQMAKVDVTITLPQFVVQVPDPTNTKISIEALLGNINVDGVSGVMNLKGGLESNITVKGGVIVDGSHLTATGSITLDDFLYAKKDPQNPDQSVKNPHYILNNAHRINVTLPENADIILDANTNVGKITSEFPIQVRSSGENGPACYYGYLNRKTTGNSDSSLDYCPKIDDSETPILTVNVSTGDVYIQKRKMS